MFYQKILKSLYGGFMEIRLTKPDVIPATDPKSIHEIIKFNRSTYARLSNYKNGILVKINGEILSNIIDYWYDGRKKSTHPEKILDFEIDHYLDENRAVPSEVQMIFIDSEKDENYIRA